jgi:hypothetical protein
MMPLKRTALAVAAAALLALPFQAAWVPDLPERLTDEEFWALSQESSEPGGHFRNADITNLTSNELLYQHVIPDLITRAGTGRVYLGVGPEQNFTYMVATRPKMAIIFDIRRGNLAMQLLYKAIFELSEDRAGFVSMLFSRPRPPGLGPSSSAEKILSAFEWVKPNPALVQKNLAVIRDRLMKTRRLPLQERDLEAIDLLYRTFYGSGYYLRQSPSYKDLMAATDATGIERSYLATEEGFAWLKDLQSRNLVVPVVGDFGGPKAIRAVGQYLKSRGGTVGAFYLSNVEQYLYQDGKWDAFCGNVATLPINGRSTFIRSTSGGFGGRGGGFINSLGAIAAEVNACR